MIFAQCEMWARAEGAGIVSMNARGSFAARFCYFCGGGNNACASALEEGRCIREQIIQSRWDSSIFVGTRFVDIYVKCGSMEDAWSVFKEMPSCHVVLWNATVGGHCGAIAIVMCRICNSFLDYKSSISTTT
jgi:pentatricopeptide repeat protein